MTPKTDSPFSPSHRPAKIWKKVILEVSPELTDPAAAFLSNLTEGGVEISSPKAPQHSKPPTEKVIGYVFLDEDRQFQEKISQLKIFLSRLRQFFPDSSPPILHTENIREEDWGSGWKKFFNTFRVSPRVVIKPTWENYDSDSQGGGADEVIIEMDPGLAFGTGHHASTSLALILIEEIYTFGGSRPGHVLDFGTGTGILAMSCALFGAKKVLALDNDPDAVTAARDNVKHNGLEKIITVDNKAIAGLTGSYDLILANITHDILISLAPTFKNLLHGDGHLILAGILQGRQHDSIIEEFSRYRLFPVSTKKREEWVAMVFNKN